MHDLLRSRHDARAARLLRDPSESRGPGQARRGAEPRGARLDGTDDDGIPLWTAISFGYTEAAEALVRCGARVDDLVAFLLDHEPDLSFREPRFGATALGAARYAGDPEIVKLLETAPHLER